MKEAVKTARSDWLRRMMDKSQARRSSKGGDGISLSDSLGSFGMALWYAGVIGQLLWNIMALLITTNYKPIETLGLRTSSNLAILFSYVPAFISLSTSGVWAKGSFSCSILSLWWNPKFRQMNNGFMNHIKGFGDWYKYQVIMLVSRGLFYYLMDREVLANPLSAATAAAHSFMFGFTIFVGDLLSFNKKC